MTSHYTWGHVTTLHDFGSVLGHPLDNAFGLSQFHGHRSWLVCEVALKSMITPMDGAGSATTVIIPFSACFISRNTHYFAKSQFLSSDTKFMNTCSPTMIHFKNLMCALRCFEA